MKISQSKGGVTNEGSNRKMERDFTEYFKTLSLSLDRYLLIAINKTLFSSLKGK
jgi:hypothetical protein